MGAKVRALAPSLWAEFTGVPRIFSLEAIDAHVLTKSRPENYEAGAVDFVARFITQEFIFGQGSSKVHDPETLSILQKVLGLRGPDSWYLLARNSLSTLVARFLYSILLLRTTRA